VYQSRVESREVESPTNLAADEPLSGRRSFGAFHRPPLAQPQNQWGLTPRACLHVVPPAADPVGSRALSQPHLSHTFTRTSSSRDGSFGSCVVVQLLASHTFACTSLDRFRSGRDHLWPPPGQPCGQPLVHGSAFSYLCGSHVSSKSYLAANL
jgi:hypothetical protein